MLNRSRRLAAALLLMCASVLAQSPFQGGVVSGQATSETLHLTLADALKRGLQYNLGPVLADQNLRAAQAARLRALSALLPTLVTRTSLTSQQINLAAFGFTGFPGIAMIVGPFQIFDTRAVLSQNVLNFSAIYGNRAGREGMQAARAAYQDARDTVVLAVSGLYLQSIAGAARIEAAQAQLKTAEALFARAQTQKAAGVVPGIEVLRAQVEMQAERQRLIFVQNEFEKQKLSLARAIGLPVGQPLALADQVPYAPLPMTSLEEALAEAYRSRADYQALAAQVRAAELMRKAARSQRLPSITLDANYGSIGPAPWNSHGTYSVAGSLNIPIYLAGRVKADEMEADARVRELEAQSSDLRNRIEFDVRTAFLDLKAAGDEVDVARSANQLAREQLTQSQDRFSAGVADNLEVVQAQQAVATADENYISSLYAYNLGKAALARALGRAEENAARFLGGH